MPAIDALIVGEDWISEHYFTTDATKESFHAKVLERRKIWDADNDSASNTGSESGTASESNTVQAPGQSTRSRLLVQRAELETRFGRLQLAAADNGDGIDTVDNASDLRTLYDDLLGLLGYRSGQYLLKDSGPVVWVSQPGVAEQPVLAVVRGRSCDALEELLDKNVATLLEPWHPELDQHSAHDTDDESPDAPVTASRSGRTGDAITSVAKALSRIVVDGQSPPFVLVLAGRWCVITDPQRWPEGRYLAVDLQLACEQNDTKRGGGIDSALACVEASSLLPAADGTVWWQSVLDESIKHTVGVSADLREGVRLSIEIIANDVVSRRRAQELPALPPDQAQTLAVQALRYLYRILFLLYAEASPELEVLPSGATEYELGYGLDRLRELVLAELHDESARTGTHLYQSLRRLFELVDRGHRPRREAAETVQDGLHFSALRADLFAPAATEHLDGVGLSNEALLRVLRHLLLSKQSGGRDRGFISYVELGINQLGAVYEGLMSYTGFFAQEDLYEVAKKGDPADGSWVVPIDRSGHLDPGDFVKVVDEHGQARPVIHAKGTFVFRLAGRERQQSASYYTPEVLTRFTVSQALEELLDQDGTTTAADDILRLSVCEPAMGSGAFAIEAVRQLATEYLTRKQRELGQKIDPDAYPREWQKVKAHIALHQVYGVDLNATAVELAEVSLWLDTMVAGLQAPWFGLRLRRGNSLVGARRSVYPVAAVADGGYRGDVPIDVPLSDLSDDLDAGQVGRSTGGRIHHFLLPSDGWGSAAEVGKDVRDLAGDAVKALKTWRSSVRRRPDRKQVAALLALSDRVEQLWQTALRRLRIAEAESGRHIQLWAGNPLAAADDAADAGRTDVAAGEAGSLSEAAHDRPAVSREQIEESLADQEGAYRRLRLVMDAWCALWFWPLTETEVAPPTTAQWIDALTMILGTVAPEKKSARSAGMNALHTAADWQQLGEAEANDRIWHGAASIEKVLDQHPWLRVCHTIAARQGFLHWELDFATVFARGGFDLLTGNPPWVRPDNNLEPTMAEFDPWWALKHKASPGEMSERRRRFLESPPAKDFLITGTSDATALRAFISDSSAFPLLGGLHADLYRCFICRMWDLQSARGVVALIHYDTHFTDEKAIALRRETYLRLRRHWQFVNERGYFEIGNQKWFGVNVYSHPRSEARFLHACSIFDPETVSRSLRHDGSGSPPVIKNDGEWDTRPHKDRIQMIGHEELRTWSEILGGENDDT